MPTRAQIIAYIRRVARSLGVPEAIALALAETMSAMDPGEGDWRAVVEGWVSGLKEAHRTTGSWEQAAVEVTGDQNVTTVARDTFGYTVPSGERSGSPKPPGPDYPGGGGQGSGGGQDGQGGGGGGAGGGGNGPGGGGNGGGPSGPGGPGGGNPGGPGGDIQAGQLQAILSGYGLNPRAFDDIIHEAIAQQWTPYQFEAALYASPQFHKMFPGIFNGDGGLKMQPGQYLQLVYGQGGYRDIANEYGIAVNRRKLGMLIEGDVSPDEWAFRAQLRQTAKENEPYRVAFNAAIVASGGQALDQADWFKFLAGESTQNLENLWESASLQTTTGLTLTAAEANAASQAIGKPGERVDLANAVNQARSIKDFIAPELQAAGISDADLVVLESGADPKNLGPRLQQIVNNRKALLSGPQTRLVAAGGGLYPAAHEGF